MEKELKDLQDTLQKSIKEGMAELEKNIGEDRTKSEEKIGALENQLKEVNEKLGKIENSPAIKSRTFGIGTSQKHMGYSINKQFVKMREAAGKNPHSFETFRDEEKIDEYSKFMINISRGLGRRQDQKALQELEELRTKASLAEGADPTGGFTVPTEFQWDLIMLNKDTTFALRECTVIPMSSNELKLPTELTRGAVAWKDEAEDLTQSEPTFGQVTLTAKKLTAFSEASNELLMDTAIDIVGLLSDQFSYGMNLELDNQVLNGTGSIVSGVLTAKAGFSVVQATGMTNFSSVSFDDISALVNKIPEGYNANLKMVFNKLIKHYLRTVKDGEDRYILNTPGGVTPGTVWEIPYFTTSQAPSSSSSSKAFLVVGDWKGFYIGRRVGVMSIEADPYGLFKSDETRFRMITRWALEVAVRDKFARLITA